MRSVAIAIMLSLLSAPTWAGGRIRFDRIDRNALPAQAREVMQRMGQILTGHLPLEAVPKRYRSAATKIQVTTAPADMQPTRQDLVGPHTPNFIVLFTNAGGPHGLSPGEHQIVVKGEQPLFTKSGARKMGLEPNRLTVVGLALGQSLEAVGLFPTAAHIFGLSAERAAIEKGNRHTLYLLEPGERWLQGRSQSKSRVLVDRVPNDGQLVTPVAFTIQLFKTGEHQLMFDPYPTKTHGPAASFATRSIILDVK